MILRLLFIFSLPFIGLPFKYYFEQDRCKTDTACYIRETCMEDGGPWDKNVLVRYKAEKLIDNTCDVFLQIRPFNSLEFQFIIRVNSSTEAISDEGVALRQGTQEQFRCKNGDQTTGNDKVTISYYGEKHPFDPHLFSCSILLKSTSERFKIMFDTLKKKPEIIFTSGGQPQSIKYRFTNDAFWVDAVSAMTCDPNIVQQLNPPNDTHVFDEVDPTRAVIHCSALQILQIKRGDPSLGDDYPKALKCTDREWTYDRINGEQSETVTIGDFENVQEKVKVACVSKKCSLCQRLEPYDCGPGCITPVFNNSLGDCAKATCPNDRWRLDYDGRPIEGKMTCEHKDNANDPRDSTWYMQPKSGTRIEIKKASCAKDANCKVLFNLNEVCPNLDEGCSVLAWSADNMTISCREPKDQLRWQTTDGETFDAVNLTCDNVKGSFSNEKGKEVEKASTVYCERTKPTTDPPPSSASALSSDTLIMIGIGVVVLIVVLAIAISPIFIVFKRKRRHAEAEKIKKREEKRRAENAALAKLATPDVIVTRKMLPDCEKTPWELRKMFPEKKDVPMDLLNNFNDDQFLSIIVMRFKEYTCDSQIAILQNLTAFNAYDPKREIEEDVEVKSVGTLRQFFALWKHCNKDMMDCVTTWEYMWRFMRILYENYIPHDDQKETGKRMVKLVVDWARPMLTELSFQIRQDEDECDTRLRCLAVRMLLWAESPDVIAEITRQANLPLSELQSPMRAVVLSFAARQLGRAEELKTKYWEEVEMDPQEGAQFGTIRQHILYGLCSARDESKKDTADEFKVLKDVMATIFDYSKVNLPSRSFVPLDQLWAFRGASEHVSNMKMAVECFVGLAPTDPDKTIEKLMMWRCNQSKEAMEVMREQWTPHIVDIFNLVCEMCTMKKQFDQAASTSNIWNEYVYRPQEIPSPLKPFNLIKLGERSSNLFNLLNDRKVATLFYEAIEEIRAVKNTNPKYERKK